MDKTDLGQTAKLQLQKWVGMANPTVEAHTVELVVDNTPSLDWDMRHQEWVGTLMLVVVVGKKDLEAGKEYFVGFQTGTVGFVLVVVGLADFEVGKEGQQIVNSWEDKENNLGLAYLHLDILQTLLETLEERLDCRVGLYLLD